MLRRLILFAAVIVVVCAPSGPSGVTRAAPATPVAPAQVALYVLRVYVNGVADIHRLISGGWDVLEARGKDYLLVMGDDNAVANLRAQGFKVAVDHQVNPPGTLAPFTYDFGYHTVVEHYQHMDSVAQLHPDLALTVTYGVSWKKQTAGGGFDLRAICITRMRPGDCSLNPNTDKPRYFLMASIHARELTTSELAWRWIDLLINGYNVDPDITALLNYNEMWVVPVANPDGRAVVEQGGDAPYLQRKNMDDTNSPPGACDTASSSNYYNQDGIDLNRNASFKWDVSGVDHYAPCDQLYDGPSQASEPEEQALEALMRNLFRTQRGPNDTDLAPITTTGTMLTLHSYSNLVLLPWGWTECYNSPCSADLRAPNDIPLRALAFHMSYFNGYFTGQASEALYAASGTTDDWAYGMLGIPGFTFEIGPTGGYCSGFTPDYTCQDDLFWPANRGAFLYQAKVARQPYALGLGPTTQVFSTTLVAPFSSTQSFTASVASNLYGTYGYSAPTANPISAAEYTIDQPPWITGTPTFSMTAQDGAFDSVSEIVSGTVNTDPLCPGQHMLYIHGSDANGNWGPVTAMWLKVPVPSGSYHCVSASASELSRIGYPNTVVTYSLQVTNTGNTSDHLKLAITGNTWSTTVYSHGLATIQSLAEATIQITVTIPPTAAGQTDTALVTVTSLDDPTKAARTILATHARYRYYLLLVYR